MRERPLCLICLLLILVFFLQNERELSLEGEAPDFLSSFGQETICISGIVESRQDIDEKERYLLKNIRDQNKGKRLRGKITIYCDQKQELLLGQKILVKGKLEKPEHATNPGEFDYANYCRSKNISYLMKHAKILQKGRQYSGILETAERIREWVRLQLKFYTGDMAGLYFAILTGDQTELPEDQKTSFQRAGIYHMLCVSGTHLSLIGMGLFYGLLKLGAGISVSGGLSLILVYIYGLITGAGVSLLRAMVMLASAIFGRMLGRTYDFLTAMSLSAMILMLDNPGVLWGSGFWMSFAASIAAGGIAPYLMKVWKRYCKKKKYKSAEKKYRMKLRFGEILIPFMCIKIVMLPLELYYQFETPVLASGLNLLLLPTLPIVLASGFLGLGMSILSWKWIGWVFFPGRVLLWIYLQLGQWMNQIPFGTVILGKPAVIQVILYYLILLGTWCLIRRNFRMSIPFFLGMSVSLVILLYRPMPCFCIETLDVGQGDCLVIRTETGKTYVSDGGSTSKTDIGKKIIIPYLKSCGVSQIEGIFVSHTDQDHISGILELIELQKTGQSGIRVKQIFLPDWDQPTEMWEVIKLSAGEAGIKIRALSQGDILEEHTQNGETAMRVEVLYPKRNMKLENMNDACLVFRLEYTSFSALFTGDIGKEIEETLVSEQEFRPVQFLKVAHHGSGYSSGDEFLEKTSPELAIISCGRKNRYGHPHKETIERLSRENVKILRTDLNGAIQVEIRKNRQVYVKCRKYCLNN